MRLPTALTVLRSFIAIVFLTHAIQRSIIYQTVDGFGGFLSAKGFPMGVVLAWLVTLYEYVGGGLMLFNKQTKYISLGFIFHQVMGITLVHARNGWFVVGPSTGGMEYSALLIVALLVIFAGASEKNEM